MNMYQSGELDQVMANFERTLKDAPIYVGASQCVTITTNTTITGKSMRCF